MDSSIRHLRKFLKKDKDLKGFATQTGFAELVECSLSLVQAVEQRITPVSKRFAKSIERRLGVDAEWLLNPEANLPIPAEDGSPLTFELIKARLEMEIVTNNEDVAGWIATNPRSRVADAIAISVRDAQLEAEQVGDYHFIADILRALDDFQKRKLGTTAGDASI